MTEFNEQQPIVNISEMSAKERAKYITDEMIYNEDELAFVRARKEANNRGVTKLDDISNDLEKSAQELKDLIAEFDALLGEAKNNQLGK